ncbi:cobalamin biosynthesis protein CobD [Rubrobacter marinus]|uniref:Cobalamin biosynthesis protein CobD n=1 Tax=Rubrobacter marinus TaxID=2653852 RepID=A0A6G8PY55_9ACTN|nr:adenosylcobinamide-phosphate synthase CbiB [Rubrobacter marinus]QIN79095.1 cobalamin biosynthesis protein CobD [Rubrobacter marinus]
MTLGRAGCVAAALAVDELLGEPPASAHPVVSMGHAISFYERRALALKGAPRQRLAGLALAAALPALAFSLSRALLALVPDGLRPAAEILLLSTTVSMRGLREAAAAVSRELDGGNLGGARARVGEFVGRDTEEMSPGEVARAAVESVAENTSDGVVAPMLYGFLLGAPGALAYKAVNTMDSMVGHETPVHGDLGLVPARLDDWANLAPSRATALAAAAVSGRFGAAWSVARSHGPRTKSPNAGWAEAAFAGALGLTLGGTNSYGGVKREGPTLGVGRPPEAGDIARATRLMRRACGLVLLSLAGVAAVRGASRSGGTRRG